VIALAALLAHPTSAEKIREFWVPFYKEPALVFAGGLGVVALLVLIFLWIVGFSNAINLTDGLDGLAIGALIAVLLRMDTFSKTVWQKLGLAGIALGLFGVGLMLYRGTAFADTFLALGFGGMLIAAIVSESGGLYARVLCLWPLKSIGTDSFGEMLSNPAKSDMANVVTYSSGIVSPCMSAA